VNSQQHVVGFTTYQQALTAATMAIFSQRANFQNVLITAGDSCAQRRFYGSAKAWFMENG
jgi:hypothetical protein